MLADIVSEGRSTYVKGAEHRRGIFTIASLNYFNDALVKIHAFNLRARLADPPRLPNTLYNSNFKAIPNYLCCTYLTRRDKARLERRQRKGTTSKVLFTTYSVHSLTSHSFCIHSP